MRGSKGQGFGWINILFYGVFFIIVFSLGLAPFVGSSIDSLDLSVWGSLGGWVFGHLNLLFVLFAVVGLFAAFVWGLSE